MPTERPKRRRQRRKSGFTAAELQFLTGEPQAGANKFESLGLEHPTRPDDFARIDALLTRAGGIVSAERIAELTARIDAKRTKPAA